MNNSKKAFTIIEILIAMLILFIAISFSSIAIKAFNKYQKQSQNYQMFYVTSLSLKEKISSIKEFKSPIYRGALNGIDYTITIEKLLNKQNYIVGVDGIGRNNGDFMVILYRLTMLLKSKTKEKSYSFLLTKQKRIR